MPTPGPWVQPADVLRVANRIVFGGDNTPYTSSTVDTGKPTFAEVVSSTSADAVFDEVASPTNTSGVDHETATSVSGEVSLIRFDPRFVNQLPVPPTPAELAAPHVVGYEYEGGPTATGVVVGPMIARSWLDATGDFVFLYRVTPPDGEPVAYYVFEMIEGTDYSLSPVDFGGMIFQQVHWIIYPNASVLSGRLEVAHNETGVVPTEEIQNALTGVSWVVPDTLPAYAFVAHNLYDANDIVGADRALDPASVTYTPSVDFSAWVRPPRYRLLYDYVPQRQFPRDDGLGISTLRHYPQRTSKQFSQRKGPAGTYL